MEYSASWVEKAERVIEAVLVIDPVMGQELVEAGMLLAKNPFLNGTRAKHPFTTGKQYAVRVRDGIVVTLNFHLNPRQNSVAVEDMTVTGPRQ